MTALTIVDRELRVAARRRSTYWTRAIAAMLATALAVWVLEASGSLAGPTAMGARLFASLATCAWMACLLAGVFLTADCLSEEKREGTLGLLFLTDLRGWDIVLGKLAATSLNGMYGLLAMIPVLGIPLIFGGVTGWEFARVAAALLETLLF